MKLKLLTLLLSCFILPPALSQKIEKPMNPHPGIIPPPPRSTFFDEEENEVPLPLKRNPSSKEREREITLSLPKDLS